MTLDEVKDIKIGNNSVFAMYLNNTQIWPFSCNPYLIPSTYGDYYYNRENLTDCYINAKYVKTILINNDDSPLYLEPRIIVSGNLAELYNISLTTDSLKWILITNVNVRTIEFFGDSQPEIVKFKNCRNLRRIILPDLSNCIHGYDLFNGCRNLTSIPFFNASNMETTAFMFAGCSLLTTIPEIDISKSTSITDMFANCTSLTTVPLLNTGNVQTTQTTFMNCPSLTTLGGFKDLGKSYDKIPTTGQNWVVLDLSYCPLLTYQSIKNVFNNLYNISSYNLGTNIAKIILSSATKALLSSSDIAIATNKGWVVQ